MYCSECMANGDYPKRCKCGGTVHAHDVDCIHPIEGQGEPDYPCGYCEGNCYPPTKDHPRFVVQVSCDQCFDNYEEVE